MKVCFQDESNNCYCKALSILNPENTGSRAASLFAQLLLLLETKQVMHLHSPMLILLFLDKSFSKGWGQSTRTEEKGFTVTAVLPSVCPWSAFIYFTAVYISLWQTQSKEREQEISELCQHPGRSLAPGDMEQQRPSDLIHHPASPTAACWVLVKHERDIDGRFSPSIFYEISYGKSEDCYPALWLGKIFMKMLSKVFFLVIFEGLKVN